jgi:hypothetical protein
VSEHIYTKFTGTSTHTHTHTHDSHSDRHEFSIDDEAGKKWVCNVEVQNSEFHCVILRYYLLLFLIPPIHYKVKKERFDVKWSVNKLNPDIHFMCELHVTVDIYRAECRLSDVASHVFSNIPLFSFT